jgi:hypothetical protein
VPHLSAARRLLLVAATVTLSLLLPLAGVGTSRALAVDECYVQLKAPAKIVVDRYYKAVEVSLKDSCGIAEYASFYEYGPRGMDNIFIFDGNATDTWDIYAWQTLGTFKTRLGGAWDQDSNELDFVSTTTKVKLGTKAKIATTRSGSKVKVAVTSTSWSPDKERQVAWNASSAKVQYQTKSGWKTLKSVTLKKGKATVTTTSKAKRTYRFVTAETGTRFGATSATSKR